MDLIQENKVLNTRRLDVDGPGTYVVRWPNLEVDKGSYSVCATLRDDGTEDKHDDADEIKDVRCSPERCYRFYYGGVEPVRFDVRDFRADSRGLHLAISASDPTIVDIYYMLVAGRSSTICNPGEGSAHLRNSCPWPFRRTTNGSPSWRTARYMRAGSRSWS